MNITESPKVKCKNCGGWHSELIYCGVVPMNIVTPHSHGPLAIIKPCQCRIIPLAQGVAILPCAKHQPEMLALLD